MKKYEGPKIMVSPLLFEDILEISNGILYDEDDLGFGEGDIEVW